MKISIKQLKQIIKETINIASGEDHVSNSPISEKETNTMECPSCGNPVQSRGRSSDGYGQTYQCPECEHGWET